MNEEVLCIEKKFLPLDLKDTEVAKEIAFDKMINLLENSSPKFIERKIAENDDNFYQLVPYITIIDQEKNLASYQRKGNEKRLNGLFSIGIGGHINRIDIKDNQNINLKQIIENGLKREVKEEIGLSDFSFNFKGIIAESITLVGRVHLGLVFLIKNINRNNCIIDKELNNFRWIKVEEVYKNLENYEIWSRLALKLLYINDVW